MKQPNMEKSGARRINGSELPVTLIVDLNRGLVDDNLSRPSVVSRLEVTLLDPVVDSAPAAAHIKNIKNNIFRLNNKNARYSMMPSCINRHDVRSLSTNSNPIQLSPLSR